MGAESSLVQVKLSLGKLTRELLQSFISWCLMLQAYFEFMMIEDPLGFRFLKASARLDVGN